MMKFSATKFFPFRCRTPQARHILD